MVRSFVALLVVGALAGCSSVEASTPKSAVATPSLPCTLPYGTRVALVSPQPGSHDVLRGATLVLVASRDLPKSVTVVTTSAKDGSVASGPLERTARPPGVESDAFSDPVYYRVTGLALHAHRHYTVALDDQAQNGCAPYAEMTGDARFST